MMRNVLPRILLLLFPVFSLVLAASNPDDSRNRIFSVDVNGGQPQLLVDDGTQPALRNDGVRCCCTGRL